MADQLRTVRQEYRDRWIAGVRDVVRVTIGNGLRERLEAPQQLPSNIVSLLALITNHGDEPRFFDRAGKSPFGGAV
jgi:hypothetical protein